MRPFGTPCRIVPRHGPDLAGRRPSSTRASFSLNRRTGRRTVPGPLTAPGRRTANSEARRTMQPFLTTSHGVLYDADCLRVLERMKSEVIDTVFADPPFNIGKDYKNGYNDATARTEYLSWCRRWILECCRILKPGGAFFLYATPELAVQFAPIMGERLDFRHWIALTMKGTWPRGKKLYPAHYALLYHTRGTPRVFNRLRLPIETCRHCGGENPGLWRPSRQDELRGGESDGFLDGHSPNRHAKFKVRPGVNELKPVIPERAILISTRPGRPRLRSFRRRRLHLPGSGKTAPPLDRRRAPRLGAYPQTHGRGPSVPFPAGAVFDFEELFIHEDKPDRLLRKIEEKACRLGPSHIPDCCTKSKLHSSKACHFLGRAGGRLRDNPSFPRLHPRGQAPRKRKPTRYSLSSMSAYPNPDWEIPHEPPRHRTAERRIRRPDHRPGPDGGAVR